MPGFGDIFGSGGIGRQFLVYGVGYEVARSLLQPIFVAVATEQWQHAVESSNGAIRQPLSPADLADMIIRGIVTKEEAYPIAAKWGIYRDDLDRMALDHGEPPPLELILALYRRGELTWSAGPVPAVSAENAIREGRIRDEWIPVLKQAQFTPPSVADAVNAAIRNQLPYFTAVALAYYAGLGVQGFDVPPDADTTRTETAFKVLYDTAGRPPAPTELAELVHRGAIPIKGRGAEALSFEQGIFEGDLKDKWEAPLEAFLEVIPSLYQIRILLEHGAVSTAQANEWLSHLGYSSAVSQALADDATAQAIVTDRQLTEANIKTQYVAGALTESEALTLLENIGYPVDAARFIVASWDLDYQLTALKASVSRIGTYFIAHKLSANEAALALRRLDLTDAQVQGAIKDWTVARSSNVRLLTEAQIADAYEYQIMDQPTAMAELAALGYTPFDAWVILSVKLKAAQPTQPPATLTGLQT